jgi:hypothetical protein
VAFAPAGEAGPEPGGRLDEVSPRRAQPVQPVVGLGGSAGSLGALPTFFEAMPADGGLTIAQDPEEAEHDGMPRAAIATGMVDWVLPVAEMPGRLLEYHRAERRLWAAKPARRGPALVARLRGQGAGKRSTDELLKLTRNDR